MQLPSRVPTKLGPRVDFKPEEFRKFLFKAGIKLKWEQAQECPCKRRSDEVTLDVGFSVPTSSRTAENRIDCPVCKGKGYFHHSPQTVVAGVTSAVENPERFRPYGSVAPGMISITLLPEHLPSWGDRFTMLDSVILYRETREREAVVESLKLPIVSRSLDLAQGPRDVAVLHAHKANANGTTTSALGLDIGTDFSVTVDGEIDWTLGDAAGTAPAVGDRYAMAYYAHPRYIVIDHPYAFRDTFVKKKLPTETFAPLPVLCNARLEFLGTEGE